MNEQIKKSLDLYLHMANFSATHPADMERFYEFIIISYNKNEQIDRGTFEATVKAKEPGIDDEWIMKKYSLYESGIELLRKYNQ